MKKILVLSLIAILCISSSVFATPASIPSTGRIQTVKSDYDGVDAFPYNTTDTAAVKGYSKVRILCDVTAASGVVPGFVVIPFYSDDTAELMYGATRVDVTEDTAFSVSTFAVDLMSVMVEENPNGSIISIKMTPYNE